MMNVTQGQFAAILAVVKERMLSIAASRDAYENQYNEIENVLMDRCGIDGQEVMDLAHQLCEPVLTELIDTTFFLLANEMLCLVEGHPTKELIEKAVEYTETRINHELP